MIQLRAHRDGCGTNDFWGAEQAVGCGVSTVVQEAPGEPDWRRVPEQAGSCVIGAAPSPQTRLPDPSLHVAETRLPWQACRPRPRAPSGAGHTGSCGLPAAAWVLAPAQPGLASLLVTGTWPHQGEDALPSPPPSRPQWVSVGWAVPTSVCGMNDEEPPHPFRC